MHLSSIPSPYGIGTMGQAAREFVDFLQASGQQCWQLLPICPTSYGDSPYQSYSTFAGNPYFIDLDELEQKGLLDKADYENVDWESTPDRVNYGALYQKRYPILRKATDNFMQRPSEDFEVFCRENAFWLEDFALFMALKDVHGGAPWSEWPEVLRNRDKKALKEAEKEYGLLSRYCYINEAYETVIKEKHNLRVWSVKLGASDAEYEGYIWCCYSRNGMNAEGETVVGSKNVPVLWCLEENDEGIWSVGEIKEMP